MFKEDDAEIDKKYEEIQKEWETKREKFEKLKRIKDNYSDVDYFQHMA
jgi:uncharacterized protein YpbB